MLSDTASWFCTCNTKLPFREEVPIYLSLEGFNCLWKYLQLIHFLTLQTKLCLVQLCTCDVNSSPCFCRWSPLPHVCYDAAQHRSSWPCKCRFVMLSHRICNVASLSLCLCSYRFFSALPCLFL